MDRFRLGSTYPLDTEDERRCVDIFKCKKDDGVSHQSQHYRNSPAVTARQSVQPSVSIRGCSGNPVPLRIQRLGHLARTPEPPVYDCRGYSELATPAQLRNQLRERAGSYLLDRSQSEYCKRFLASWLKQDEVRKHNPFFNTELSSGYSRCLSA